MMPRSLAVQWPLYQACSSSYPTLTDSLSIGCQRLKTFKGSEFSIPTCNWPLLSLGPANTMMENQGSWSATGLPSNFVLTTT